MKKNSLKKIIIFSCLLCFAGFHLISEDSNFVVIESVTNHELNPHVTALSSDNDILGNIYEGLFTSSPINLEPQYAIASEYKVSRDKRRWIIKLRENACFSNGEKITANDVKDSWIQLLATPNAPYASLLDIIRGAKEYRTGIGKEEDVGLYVTDENTISLYLNSPANYLPRVLCHTAFSILHRSPTVFSGAYVIEDIRPGITILTKNHNYWDKDNVKIEKVTFLQSDDTENNAYLYNTGAVDWVMGNAAADKILDQDAIQVNPQFGISFYFFKKSKNKQNQESSLWDYKEFRNAVLEALPWDVMRKGNFMPAETFVYPLTGYPTVDGFNFTDPIEAKLKMKEAREKYNVGADERIPLIFEIVENGMSNEEKIALKNALDPIGVDVSFNEIPGAIYFDNVKKSNSDIFTYTWVGDFADPLTFLELFKSSSSMNESGWENSQYDKLLEDAAMVSSEERYKLLAEAEKILLDDFMIIPIAYPVSYNIVDLKEVGGWIPNAFDTHLFKYIYKKRQKVNLPNVVMK